MQLFLSPATTLYHLLHHSEFKQYSHGRLTNMHSCLAVLFISEIVAIY